VLDVETVPAFPLDADTETGKAIAEMAEGGPDEYNLARYASLRPPLARVVTVAMVLHESGRTRVFQGEERDLLTEVNLAIDKATRLVTFNGRRFDLAVLVHRSAINGVRLSSMLLRAASEYRYKPNLHIDVLDQFTFFGASLGGSLRAFCLGYGLKDPKALGNGAHVGGMTDDERAAYCLADAVATDALYKRWLEDMGGGR
jgi:hypothetical protein